MGDGDLTYVDITALAKIISKGDMESIALGYFEQDWNRVRTHKDDLRSTEEFNREILMDWKKANPGVNQRKVNSLTEELNFKNFPCNIDRSYRKTWRRN